MQLFTLLAQKCKSQNNPQKRATFLLFITTVISQSCQPSATFFRVFLILTENILERDEQQCDFIWFFEGTAHVQMETEGW